MPATGAATDALRELARRPPFTEAATRAAEVVLPAALDADLRRLRSRVAAAAAAGGAEEHLHALHQVRKAAKRLRYAAEVAAPVLGARAETLAETAKAVQTVLGDHRDSALVRAALASLSSTVSPEVAVVRRAAAGTGGRRGRAALGRVRGPRDGGGRARGGLGGGVEVAVEDQHRAVVVGDGRPAG